jgi:hypothetical protein
MWTMLLKEHLSLLQLGILMFAAFIFILNAARDVFERDSAPLSVNAPDGLPPTPDDFRYTSDFARDARDDLLEAADILRALLIPYTITIIISFGTTMVFQVLRIIGSPERIANVCGANRPMVCSISRCAASVYEAWERLNIAENMIGVLPGVLPSLDVILFSKWQISSILWCMLSKMELEFCAPRD